MNDTKTTRKEHVSSFILKLIFEFVIIFLGVYLAFMFENHSKVEEKKQRDIQTFNIVITELRNFADGGIKGGYIEGFEKRYASFKKEVDDGEMPLPKDLLLYGDIWKLHAIPALIQSGAFNEIDIEVFIYISKYNTVHKNFIKMMDDFNNYVEQNIVPNLDKGTEEFYNLDSKEMKRKYRRYLFYLKQISQFYRNLANMAYEISIEMDERKPK